jgi:hypothetical protein
MSTKRCHRVMAKPRFRETDKPSAWLGGQRIPSRAGTSGKECFRLKPVLARCDRNRQRFFWALGLPVKGGV